MKKLNFKFNHYSKLSVLIRIILSLVFVALIILVVVFRVEISKKIYHWGDYVAEGNIFVHFIDVGQGDATLIEFDDGSTMLIDAGPKSSSDDLVNYINNLGISTIDYFLITHPDADHVGGGIKIFENFQINNFYRPMISSVSEKDTSSYPVHDTGTYDEIIQAYLNEENCNLFYNSDAVSIIGDNYSVNIIYPDGVYEDTNDSSAICFIKIYDFKFLFMADADTKIESKLIEIYGYELQADVLKVGHHGAETSTSEEFLEVVKPNYAVISVGENDYGHPSEKVLELLDLENVKYFITYESGNIVASVSQALLNFDSNTGKMIDYATIVVVLSLIILLVWGIPDFWNKNQRKKDIKNINI